MQRISLWMVCLASGVFTMIWVGWPFIGAQLISILPDYQRAGTFGDSFGAITSLFSMLGLIGILITILQQQNDQHVQRFESSFFQTLQLLRDLRDEVRYKLSPEYRKAFEWDEATESQGVEAFSAILREFRWVLSMAEQDGDGDISSAAIRKRIEESFAATLSAQRGFSVEPYFRVLYAILKKIDEDEVLTKQQKLDYGRLVRSQLTSDEIALVGINGLSHRSQSFSVYVAKFRLLKYLEETDFVKKIVQPFYPSHTFKSSSQMDELAKSLRKRGRL